MRRKLEQIYERLAHFTKESLDKVDYSVISNYNTLCSGFIRQLQVSVALGISSEIILLIEAYYAPNKLLINSYKFQWESTHQNLRTSRSYKRSRVVDLWESTGV